MAETVGYIPEWNKPKKEAERRGSVRKHLCERIGVV